MTSLVVYALVGIRLGDTTNFFRTTEPEVPRLTWRGLA